MQLRHWLVGATTLALILATGTHVGAAASPLTTEGTQDVGIQDVSLNGMGGGAGVVAVSPTGAPIVKAVGTFENVNVASVESPLVPGGAGVANAYTLQLNTNSFPTPKCQSLPNPSPNPRCEGSVQFVFANNGTTGELYIKYRLGGYNNTCPNEPDLEAEFDWKSQPLLVGNDCWLKSSPTTINANTLISGMNKFKLTGELSATSARVIFTPDGGVTKPDAVSVPRLELGAPWTEAEFNVFGYAYKSEAILFKNNGFGTNVAYTRVRTMIDYGGDKKPRCSAIGFSKETNNLFQGEFTISEPNPPLNPAPPGEPGPAAVFIEKASTSAPAEVNCSKAVMLGDTHQVTFAGTLYDFQASGDFVEAQVGTEFEVQTRKASAAPTWPNASMNRAAAVRMGTTTVTVCEGTRLFVDGQAADLPINVPVTLPSGVTLFRRGNIHSFTDKYGNSMRVELRGSYLDVHVGLGRWPVPVSGLLGNPNNDPRYLQPKDGNPILIPDLFNLEFFHRLYNEFGDSWRVPATSSLLSPCSAVVPGNPTQPMFPATLDPAKRDYGRNVCQSAGVVVPAWREACALDVIVFGTTAAAAGYVNRRPPEVDGNRLRECPSSTGGPCRPY